MVDGLKKEGVSVLDSISNNKNNIVDTGKKPVKHSTQITVLVILAAFAIITGLFFLANGGMTGASISTLGASSTTSLSDSTDSGLTTSSSEGGIQNTDGSISTKSNDESNQPESQLDSPSSDSLDKDPESPITDVDTSRTEDPIAFELEFSNVPEVDAKISLSEISLTSNYIGSSIRLNGDLLEADSEVTVDLSNFLGRLRINEHTVSLDGSISQIKLNGVSILSDSEIEIEVDALSYSSVTTDEISFSYMFLHSGEGTLEVIDRLTYELDSDSLDLYDYYGSMIVTTGDKYPFALSGEVESLESSSNILQLGIE